MVCFLAFSGSTEDVFYMGLFFAMMEWLEDWIRM